MKKILLGLLVLPMFLGASLASAEVGGTITKSTNGIATTSNYDLLVNNLVVNVLKMLEWKNEDGAIAFTDTNYSVNYGCNTIFGSFSMNRMEVNIGQSASTMMACEEALMNKDQAVIKTLSEIKTLTFRNGKLVMAGTGGELSFTPSFKKAEVTGK
jgi:heat shock protein HslJ